MVGCRNGGGSFRRRGGRRGILTEECRRLKPRLRYRPPNPRRAVDGLLLVGGQNDGRRFLKTGRPAWYIHRGSLGPPKPHLRYRAHRPRRAVNGLLFFAWSNWRREVVENGVFDLLYLHGVTGVPIPRFCYAPRRQGGRLISYSWCVAEMTTGDFENGAVDAVYQPGIAMAPFTAPPLSRTPIQGG